MDSETTPHVYIPFSTMTKILSSQVPHQEAQDFEHQCGLRYVTGLVSQGTYKYQIIDTRKFQLAKLRHGL